MSLYYIITHVFQLVKTLSNWLKILNANNYLYRNMGFVKCMAVPYLYISVNFYIYFKHNYAENSFSHLQDTIKNDRTIDLSFVFHRSSFAKMAVGHVGPRLSPGTRTIEDGGQHNGITNDFSSATLRAVISIRDRIPRYAGRNAGRINQETARPLRFHFYWRRWTEGREKRKDRERKREEESVPKRVQGLRLLDRPRRLSMISFTSKWKRANKTTAVLDLTVQFRVSRNQCLRLDRFYEIILFLIFFQISLPFYLIIHYTILFMFINLYLLLLIYYRFIIFTSRSKDTKNQCN